MLKNIENLAKKFNNNITEIQKELRNVQTKKCRLQKQKNRSDYEKLMTETLKYEQLLKETKTYLKPKKMFVTEMNQEHIKNLNFDETMKAIKSIQSKKCNSQYDDDKTEYEKACQIESWLLEHKETVKPIDETVVKKSTVQDFINELEKLDKKVDTKYVIEQLTKMIQ